MNMLDKEVIHVPDGTAPEFITTRMPCNVKHDLFISAFFPLNIFGPLLTPDN